ncbi:MAG: tRNA (adenosine(37)-N6)-threonylcarbamoyltransferase complex ATPase subunit type 1 TsaE [Candidatus Krumholzibacteriota bacterium]|nr:tRNA (adenosine(37)-N6)-threonylcarbamoyltransferase complex ATPase subunit type 1 TsaE [Candidatus Krumholzibacteriota bacterium]
MSIAAGSPTETAAVAAALGRVAAAGDWVALTGVLGAGKTLFVAAFAEALGVPPRSVDSPSFVLLNEYAGRLPVYHFDAYRLAGGEEELTELGFFDERLAGGVVLVEWADRVAPFLPAGALRVVITVSGETVRRLEIAGATPRQREALIAAVAASVEAPAPDASSAATGGDAPDAGPEAEP